MTDDRDEEEGPLEGLPFDSKQIIKGMKGKQAKYYPPRLWEVTYFGVNQGELKTVIYEAHVCDFNHGVLTLSERIAFDEDWGAVHNTLLMVPLDNVFKVECKGAMPTPGTSVN